MKFDGVFEGGGVKIPALCGAYESIIEHGFEPSHMAGTSAGAIAASVVAAGYRPDEIKKIIMETDFNRFTDGGSRLVSKLWNLAFSNGLYKGDAFYSYIKEILAAKGVHTFKDLRVEGENGRYQYKLKVMASDVTQGALLELPRGVQEFGISPDELEVALAIRMSMSIPFFFRPVFLRHVGEAQDHAIVDGGLLSNFPIWTWDDVGEPEWPTFGLLLFENGSDKPQKTSNPLRLGEGIFKTMMKAHDKQFIRPDDFTNRTISIPTGSVSSIDFGITQQRKGILYKSGVDAADEFLKDWSWPQYKKWAVNSRSRN